MTSICVNWGQGDGPMTWIWRRPLEHDGRSSGRWVRVGYACDRPLPMDRGLSLADIRRAFRQVHFAKPVLSS
jgi:hypothetical protein